MESPSGPRFGKLTSSGLPRGRTPKHGHPQESVRTTTGPENNNNKHSEWWGTTFKWEGCVMFRSMACFLTYCLELRDFVCVIRVGSLLPGWIPCGGEIIVCIQRDVSWLRHSLRLHSQGFTQHTIHTAASADIFWMGYILTEDQRFLKPQCNSTPLATEGPGNYNIFPQTALQWENQTNKQCQALTWVKPQAIWMEMEDFWKERAGLGNYVSIQ